jgi:hypothetical protein
MPNSVYSPFRSTVTYKPKQQGPEIDIYYCIHCGKSFQALGYGEHGAPVCCGEPASQLEAICNESAPEEFRIDYSIVGGLNNDAIKVRWNRHAEIQPQWFMLRTFTGSYLRYVTPKKKPPMIFPMADEDSYVYCNKTVCEKCTFRCKKGFVIYAYFHYLPLPTLVYQEMDMLGKRYSIKFNGI